MKSDPHLRTKILIGLTPVVTIAVLAGAAIGAMFFLGVLPPAPSDDDMLGYFNAHRTEFDGLLDGYSKQSLQALGISAANEDHFYTWSKGSVLTSEDRGYAYSEQPLLNSQPGDGSVGFKYRRIDAGWYLFTLSEP